MPQPPTTPALSLNNINISIAGKEICHDINLTINPGECHILIGPNGSGKSTLLCAIMGIKPFTITSGTILLNGVDITTYGITDRARAGLGLAFQRPIGLEGVSVRRLAHALGAALDTSEDLADALMHTTASIFAPNTIGGLSRSDHPTRNLNRDGPYPFYYVPGWKMFFASDSPHYQRATQLATRTAPVANGAIFTFGTPNTYPTILNQW